MIRKRITRMIACTAVKLLFLVGSIATISQGQQHWRVLPSDTSLASQPSYNSVDFGNNTFVASTAAKEIWSLQDSVWNVKEQMTREGLTSVLFFKEKFIVAGFSGQIYTSTDGERWEEQVSNVQNNVINRLGCSDKMVVAVLNSGGILTSADGITWKLDSLDTNRDNNCIAYGNGKFLISSDLYYMFPEDSLYVSQDGLQWTKTKINQKLSFTSMTFGNGMFIGHAFTGDMDDNGEMIWKTFKSSDGITWSQVDVDTSIELFEVKFINNQFIGVGTGIVFSSDGNSWTKATGVPDSITIPSSGKKQLQLSSVAYGNKKFIAVGNVSLVSDGSESGINNASTNHRNNGLHFNISSANGFISIIHSSNNTNHNINFNLFDISGKLVISKRFSANSLCTAIPAAHLKAGSYLATVSENGSLLDSKTICIIK